MTFPSKLWIVALLLVWVVGSASAQEGYEHLSPFAHGAGRTYAITSHGLSAVGLNPAQLEPEGDHRFEVRVLPLSTFGVDAGASFRDAGSISTVFGIKPSNITDSDRHTITNLFLNEKLSGRADIEVLGVMYDTRSIGTFAFTWTTHVGLRTDIPEAFLQFFVHAESQLLQYDGSFSNFDLQGMWYNEYALSYARNLFDRASTTDDFLRSIKVGGALKFISGIAYLGLDPNNSFSYHAKSFGDSIAVNYIFRSAYGSDFDPNKVPTHFTLGFLTSNSAGSGYGFDLGISADLISDDSGSHILTAAASLTDLGQIIWTTNATTRTADHLTKIVRVTGGTVQGLNDSLRILGGTLRHVTSFPTALPTMLRLAAGLDLNKLGMQIGGFETKAAAEYDAGLSSVVGSLNHPRLGFGLALEAPSSTASLRLAGGYFFQSGSSDLTFGIGTTLFSTIALDLASAHVTDLFKSGAARTDVAFSIRAQF